MINFSSSFCSSRPCFVAFMHLTFKGTIIQNAIYSYEQYTTIEGSNNNSNNDAKEVHIDISPCILYM